MPKQLPINQLHKDIYIRYLMAKKDYYDALDNKYITDRAERIKDAEERMNHYDCLLKKMIDLELKDQKTISQNKLRKLIHQCGGAKWR